MSAVGSQPPITFALPWPKLKHLQLSKFFVSALEITDKVSFILLQMIFYSCSSKRRFWEKRLLQFKITIQIGIEVQLIIIQPLFFPTENCLKIKLTIKFKIICRLFFDGSKVWNTMWNTSLILPTMINSVSKIAYIWIVSGLIHDRCMY